MAQQIKLKRSAIAGKVPTTGSLAAGELAINTVDGKLYFKRDDDTVQSIVTTNATITGSVNINGSITGSDIQINQWGSVSGSLAAISSAATALTLQDITDNGNTTTNNITVGSITSVVNGPLGFPALFKTTNGQNTVTIESSGSSGTNPGEAVLRFRDHTGALPIDGTITYGGSGGDIFVIENNSGTKLQLQGPLDDQQLWLYNGGDTGSLIWGDDGTTFITRTGTSDTRFFGTASYATQALSASYIPTLQQVTDEGSTTTNNIKIGNSITFDEGFETTTAISSSGGKLFVTTWDEVVGFNTLTPDLLLASAGGIHVNKDTGGQASIRLTVANTGSNGGSIITHNVTAGNDLYIQNRASGSIFLGTNVASTGVNQFSLSEAGNLSVSGPIISFGNTSNPETVLAIRNSNSTAGYLMFNDGTSLGSSPGFVKYDHSNNSLSVGTNTFTGLTLDTNRKLRLNAYGSGTVTGTPAYLLATDSSGNIIETSTTVVSASYAVTASFASTATSASHALTAVTASTSTFVTIQDTAVPDNNYRVTFSPGTGAGTPLYRGAMAYQADTDTLVVTSISGSALHALSASYALTASSVEQLNQDITIVGNLTVFGTSSFTSVTSSNLVVDEPFIFVNVFTTVDRFGGLKVIDSGSINGTASLAWDSQHNHWVYQNASGSMYSGGMLLSGPRNTGSLGDEPNLTKWYVARSDGGDHLNDTQIFSSGSKTDITGSLTTTGKVTINTVDNYGADPDKFLAIVGGEVVYRTGAELLSDIGGQTSGTFIQNAGSGGVARYIMRYADSNSATTSSIYENLSGNIGIKTTNPSAPLDVNGNIVVSGSLTVRGTTAVLQEGIAVTGTTSLAIKSINTTTYQGAFLDYVISSSTNRRAGTLTVVWTASDIEWKDVSTLDLGSTDGVEFAPVINGSNADIALTLPAGTWTLKGHLRYM